LVLASCALAQSDRATLAGTVTDSTGAQVPGATVALSDPDTGLKREAQTGSSGSYAFALLPIGTYNLTVSLQGFRSVTYKDVRLGVGDSRTLDVKLEVAAVSTAVNVESQATPLEREAATLGSVIGAQQVGEMPLNGRHWAGLMALAPGAINTGAGDFSSIRFVGRARDDNMARLDGIDTTAVKDPRQDSNIRLIVSAEAIAEFRVSSMLYTAETGGGQGAHVSLVSKSGSNEFHGSLFEMFRNQKTDARSFFDAEKPPFHLNQFGGSLGGPIIKNKTFFYLNYEGLRQSKGITFAGRLVPSAALRSQVLAKSPALKPVIDAYPLGNKATANANVDELSQARRQWWSENSGLIKIDHRFTDKDSITGRFSTDGGASQTPSDVGTTYGGKMDRPSNLVLSYQRLVTPTTVNELKFGMNRSVIVSTTYGHIFSTVNVPGLMSLTGDSGSREFPTSYSLIDSIAITKGRHTIKAGTEIRRIHMNSTDNFARKSSISYTSINNFINNVADSLSGTAGQAVHGMRRTFYFGYVQDDFKLRSNLALNYGLRYEYYTVPYEINGLEKVIDFPPACNGLCPAGSPWFNTDRNNFDPRVSLAWSPRAFKDKTVFRMGVGAYHGAGQNDDLASPLDSDIENFSLTATDTALQGRGLSYPIDPYVALAKSAGVGSGPRMNQRQNRRDMYSMQYGFSVQQQLPSSFMTQVGYVGNQGHKIFDRRYVNNYIDPISRIRPLPQFARFDTRENLVNTNFNGLQFSLQRRFTGGFLWGTEYMWSHAIDQGAPGGGESGRPQNNLCYSCERGNSPQDIRHTWTSSWVLELPFGPGKRFLKTAGPAGKLIGGWELSGMWAMRTGRMFTPTITRSSGDMYDGNTSDQRPDLVAPIVINKDNPDCYIQNPGNPYCGSSSAPAPFGVPAKYKWGNAGRSLAEGPGLIHVDFSLHKKTKITERQGLDFRFEMFNMLNRANFGQPGNNMSSPAALGRITGVLNTNIGVGTARQIQFTMRYSF
jgi:hypothetical protein